MRLPLAVFVGFPVVSVTQDVTRVPAQTYTSTANDPGVPERSGATLDVSDVEALGDCP